MRQSTSRIGIAGLCWLTMVSTAVAQGAGVGANRIGHAIDIRGTVESNVMGHASPLYKGGVVYGDQWVNTRANSVAGLGLIDESKIHIGPNSSVKLDKSKYDPAKRGGIVSLRIRGGTQALVNTAATDSTNYRLRDPNGVLSVGGGR